MTKYPHMKSSPTGGINKTPTVKKTASNIAVQHLEHSHVKITTSSYHGHWWFLTLQGGESILAVDIDDVDGELQKNGKFNVR